MKAKELQIDDLVLYEGEVSRVKEVSVTGNLKVQQENEVMFVVAYKVQDIELTPKILKLNGWRYDERQREWSSPEDISYREPMRLQMDGGGNLRWIVGYVLLKPIISVADLQHAFRVCGLNELANNFKVK